MAINPQTGLEDPRAEEDLKRRKRLLIGAEGAYIPTPGEQQFYGALQQQLGSQAYAAGQMQTKSALDALQSRGLGRSSIAGQAVADIGRQTQQNITTSALGLRQQQQAILNQRINAALNFERQKEMARFGAEIQNKYNKKKWWQTALPALGTVAGAALGGPIGVSIGNRIFHQGSQAGSQAGSQEGPLLA